MLIVTHAVKKIAADSSQTNVLIMIRFLFDDGLCIARGDAFDTIQQLAPTNSPIVTQDRNGGDAATFNDDVPPIR